MIALNVKCNMRILCLVYLVGTTIAQDELLEPIVGSPIGNECRAYDGQTGQILTVKTITVGAAETDWKPSTDWRQRIKLPVAGAGAITLAVTRSADLAKVDAYEISFYYNTFTSFYMMEIRQSIDRDVRQVNNQDDLDVILFTVTCSYDVNGQPAEDFVDIRIKIVDSNDNAPQFEKLPYSVNIKEALPVQSTVFDVSATDLDISTNKDISFAILTGATFNGQTLFIMPDSGIGFIQLSNTLDYEQLIASSNTQFKVVITAKDNAVAPLVPQTSTATVTINVEDSDDLPPTFYHPECRALTNILYACDGVQYSASVVSGILNNVTSLTPTVNGNETTFGPMRALDLDRLSAPINFEIVESIPSGYVNRFSIITSGPASDTNLPDRNLYTATITQNSVIARSEVKRFDLLIKAQQTDNMYMYIYAYVKFVVVPRNQNPPNITGGIIGYVEENVPLGTYVRASASGIDDFKLLISDLDLASDDSQVYRYKLIGGAPFAFRSYGDVVLLYTTGNLDREIQATYVFEVMVEEDVVTGSHTSTTTLTVSILDINDNPPVFTHTMYTASILEGNYNTTDTEILVGTEIKASDLDAGVNGEVHFRIRSAIAFGGTLSQSQLLGMTSIDTTGSVRLHGVVYAGLYFVLTIEAVDKAVLNPRTQTTTLAVTVISADNNAPVFRSLAYSVQVSEAAKGQSFVLNVEATDMEDSLLKYSFDSGDFGKFEINDGMATQLAARGEILIAGSINTTPLNYEIAQHHVFSVKAEDSSGRIGTATVTVSVIDVNSNSSCINSKTYYFFVSENQPSAFVGSVASNDADDADTIFYKLLDVSNFSINAGDGRISTIGALDYDLQNQYVFKAVSIYVSVGGAARSSTATITVNVMKAVDNTPVIVNSDSWTSIIAGAAVGFAVLLALGITVTCLVYRTKMRLFKEKEENKEKQQITVFPVEQEIEMTDAHTNHQFSSRYIGAGAHLYDDAIENETGMPNPYDDAGYLNDEAISELSNERRTHTLYDAVGSIGQDTTQNIYLDLNDEAVSNPCDDLGVHNHNTVVALHQNNTQSTYQDLDPKTRIQANENYDAVFNSSGSVQ